MLAPAAHQRQVGGSRRCEAVAARNDAPGKRQRTGHQRGSTATGECPIPPPRELAQRLSGTVEVLLLWHPQIDRAELSVRDLATGGGFHIEIAPGNAIDAFHHPYAYAAKGENSYRRDRDETTSVDA
jgi:hypothetical protein